MTVEQLNSLCKDTLMEHLQIVFTEMGNGWIVAKMPVNSKTFQPSKRLHGGASMALAESVGSAGSFAMIDSDKFNVLGTEINGSHVGTTTENEVYAIGTLVYKGRTQHIWEIRIQDTSGKLISICRLTNKIVPVQQVL